MRIAENILLANMAQDDQQSFRELFDRYWEPLFVYAFRVLHNREDAEEVVQEFFIHLWNKRRDLPELQSVNAYLFTAIRNRLLNHLAVKKNPVTQLDSVKENSNDHAVENHFEKKEKENMIRTLAAALPRKMQQVYMMHQFAGLSIPEIASATGNSEQTVRNQLNSAVKKLSVVYRSEIISLAIGSFLYFL